MRSLERNSITHSMRYLSNIPQSLRYSKKINLRFQIRSIFSPKKRFHRGCSRNFECNLGGLVSSHPHAGGTLGIGRSLDIEQHHGATNNWELDFFCLFCLRGDCRKFRSFQYEVSPRRPGLVLDTYLYIYILIYLYI